MWLPSVTFDTVASFIDGADMASNGSFLAGFREWLIVKVDDGDNLHWTALILELAFPKARSPRKELEACEDHLPVIEIMFQLLDSFCQERQESGLRLIYLTYEKWLRKQSWYKRGWPGWVEL